MICSEYVIPGLRCRDHQISVPLDWSAPAAAPTIDVFAREVVDPARDRETLPLLLFLQGGPGYAAPRPCHDLPWLSEALKTHRVILLDQRGTGRSTRIEGRTMARFPDGADAARFLCRFRADSIVRDAEHLRKTVFGGARWETLGQSYGGFITLTYLSLAPEGLAACYITGGLPGLAARADDIYRRTFPRARAKTERFYRRYPDDKARVASIADRLAADDVRLPDGDRLTTRRLQFVGNVFGMGDGFERVHWLLDEAFADARGDGLSDAFLAGIQTATAFENNPLWAVLQESIYGQGDGPTAWAAERLGAEHPDFNPGTRPLRFFGEMMFPWMFEEIRGLRPFQSAAEALAQVPRYDPLYDAARLANNEVPVAALVYFDDLYVDAGLSVETAGQIGNAEAWITNEYEHDGLRISSDVFGRLRDNVRGRGGPSGR